MTEKEMRDLPDPWPKTKEELHKLIDDLTTQEHDYGTCVYAMSLASIAVKHYIAHVLGVTGFQASMADMDYLKRARNMENGFRLINYENLLYPQYLTDEYFPSLSSLEKEVLPHLAKRAKELLAERGTVHPDVKARWEYIVANYPEPAVDDN